MAIQKRNIVLFLDNAASHPRDMKLKNVKIVFLPPNTTAVCQPLDQGVIQNFKTHYRATIIKHLLPNMEANNSARDLVKSINVLDALYFFKESWNKVTPETIKNCFRKAGFTKEIISSESESEDDIPLSTLATFIRHIAVSENLEGTEFVNIDENLLTESDNIEVQFVEDQNISSSEDDISIITEDPNKISSYKEALEQIGRLKKFSEEDYTAFEHIKYLESYYVEQLSKEMEAKLKQKNISDFFHPL